MSDQRKSKRSAAIAALAVGGALVVGSAGGAYAGHKIQTSDIAKNAVAYRKLGVGVQHKLDRAAKPGPKGADGVGLGGHADLPPVTITDIGGSFGKFTATVRATSIGTLHLDAGQYLVSSTGHFNQVDDTKTDEHPVLELALRIDDGSDWGVDAGTCFTGAFPGGPGDIDQSCSASQLITVGTGGADVKVLGFGYNSDQGTAGSNNFTAGATVTALKVRS